MTLIQLAFCNFHFIIIAIAYRAWFHLNNSTNASGTYRRSTTARRRTVNVEVPAGAKLTVTSANRRNRRSCKGRKAGSGGTLSSPKHRFKYFGRLDLSNSRLK
jgi:hypothetical protein